MKKLLIIFFASFALLSLFSVTHAQGLVPCGTEGVERCELEDIFLLVFNVYNFIVWDIATPLAGLIIVIGGVMFIISAGNPGLASKAKSIVIWSVIAWFLIWGSWLIIDTVLNIIGYTGPR